MIGITTDAQESVDSKQWAIIEADTHLYYVFYPKSVLPEYMPELLLPLLYSHLLFNPTDAPLPAVGLGVLGAPRILPSLPPNPGPSGDGEP